MLVQQLMQASTDFSGNNTMHEGDNLSDQQHEQQDDNDDTFNANELLNTFRQSFSTVNSILGQNLNLGLSAASCKLWECVTLTNICLRKAMHCITCAC
jgi:hypothetical protein